MTTLSWSTSRDAVPDWHTQITVFEERSGERVATVFGSVAHARLIASAPDLLAALSALEPVAHRLGGEHPRFDTLNSLTAMARAAISKATQP